MEVWKDIKGYEGLYQVSDQGRVFSVRSSRCLTPTPVGKYRYLRVVLTKDGVNAWCYVHRLVAEAFIPNPDELPQVNHKDEDKSNNVANNLEFCTAAYNTRYGTRGKRIGEKLQRPCYCIELNEVFESLKEAQEKTGVKYQGISLCCQGKIKTAGGMRWRYAE